MLARRAVLTAADRHDQVEEDVVGAGVVRVAIRPDVVGHANHVLPGRRRQLEGRVDIAIAVDTPDGLIVPVIRRVEQKSAEQLRDDLDSIKTKTRARTVAPEEMKDFTFTLSNFGMMAGRYATPVVVPPTIAILGAGGVRHDVVPVLGGIETHRRIPLSLSFDHRCATGGEACRFLAGVIGDLQRAS